MVTLAKRLRLRWAGALALLTTALVVAGAVRVLPDIPGKFEETPAAAGGTVASGLLVLCLGLGLAVLGSLAEVNPPRRAAVWLSLLCYMGLVLGAAVPEGHYPGNDASGNLFIWDFVGLGYITAIGTAVAYGTNPHRNRAEQLEPGGVQWRDGRFLLALAGAVAGIALTAASTALMNPLLVLLAIAGYIAALGYIANGAALRQRDIESDNMPEGNRLSERFRRAMLAWCGAGAFAVAVSVVAAILISGQTGYHPNDGNAGAYGNIAMGFIFACGIGAGAIGAAWAVASRFLWISVMEECRDTSRTINHSPPA